MKKLITFVLVLTMLLTVFACASNKNDNGNDKPATTPPVNTDEEYPLPIEDFNGAKYRVSMFSENTMEEFFIMEASPNVKTELALYQRNMTVQDRYDVQIVPVITHGEGYFGHTTVIVNSILSDFDEYDLVTSYAMAAGPLIMNTCLLDLKSQDNIDLDASYWLQDVNSKYEIDGHLYTAVGDTSIYALKYTYAMMFNRTKGDAEEITDEVFEKIDNNEWTIDYFNTLVSNIYYDVDDENGPSYYDFYGFQGELETNLDNYTFAFDIPMMDNSGKNGNLLEFVYGGKRLATAVDKINTLYWENSGSFVRGDHIEAFTQGRAMFATILLNDCFTYLKEMDDVYVILPYPMLDEDQDGYRTGMMDNVHVMGIASSTPNPDMVALITEALNYEAEKTLYPAYFDEALQGQYVRDERSIEMLNILLEGRTADFGTLLQNNLDNISIWFRWMIQDKNRDSATYVGSYYDSITAKIEAVVDKYREGAN